MVEVWVGWQVAIWGQPWVSLINEKTDKTSKGCVDRKDLGTVQEREARFPLPMMTMSWGPQGGGAGCSRHSCL